MIPSKDISSSSNSPSWQQAERILEILSSLSCRSSNLYDYLQEIACGVSSLLGLDWSVVTFCWEDKEKVMASSLKLDEGEHIYSLHGILTNTVVTTGKTLCVEDAVVHPEYGKPPEGYRSYLGIPLRTFEGEVIGTICSFCIQPRQFTQQEVHVVELFAERAANAIDNYNLYQQQRKFNEILEREVAKRTEELKAAQAKLIEQERLAAIGQFASMIVHEIRNPVTTIMMGLNALKQVDLSDRNQMRLSLAIDEGIRLQNLLQEILLYAKPQVLQTEEIELDKFLEEMVISLSEMPEACERQLEVISLQTDIRIKGDRHKLKQVLINLVRNAYEAIAPGDVVTCQVIPNQEPNYIGISIHNGGSPIPSEILSKLTEPFCSGKPGGTGLGLAIVKRIVDAHGGALSIKSQLETGTTISFTVPVAD